TPRPAIPSACSRRSGIGSVGSVKARSSARSSSSLPPASPRDTRPPPPRLPGSPILSKPEPGRESYITGKGDRSRSRAEGDKRTETSKLWRTLVSAVELLAGDSRQDVYLAKSSQSSSPRTRTAAATTRRHALGNRFRPTTERRVTVQR